ncbi:MAG: hypothetical protein ACRD4Y_17655 [Candidatus Acidiferrales bacterium]
MKFWLCVSLSLVAAGCLIPGVPLGAQDAAPAGSGRVNETLLAGLRPGRDTLAMAEKRFHRRELVAGGDSANREWRDACSGRGIRLELDAKSVVQSITISTLETQAGSCSDRPADFLEAKNWVTGRGLRIGDSQDRVTAIYGEPNSSGPASKNGHDLALMYYQFDWAGSDVPQVMEVLCARDSGRVVEITLAYPSL